MSSSQWFPNRDASHRNIIIPKARRQSRRTQRTVLAGPPLTVPTVERAHFNVRCPVFVPALPALGSAQMVRSSPLLNVARGSAPSRIGGTHRGSVARQDVFCRSCKFARHRGHGKQPRMLAADSRVFPRPTLCPRGSARGLPSAPLGRGPPSVYFGQRPPPKRWSILPHFPLNDDIHLLVYLAGALLIVSLS